MFRSPDNGGGVYLPTPMGSGPQAARETIDAQDELEAVAMPEIRSALPSLVLALLVAYCAAAIGGCATAIGLPEWNPSLAKPSWTPPNWLFGPVWTLLYTLMGLASWLVWREDSARVDPGARRAALGLYAVQLALNALWSWLFFGWGMLLASAVEVVLLFVLIALTILAFAKVRRAAAWMLLPYLAWVGFASALTIAITVLNR